jgi:hypothetical protein
VAGLGEHDLDEVLHLLDGGQGGAAFGEAVHHDLGEVHGDGFGVHGGHFA